MHRHHTSPTKLATLTAGLVALCAQAAAQTAAPAPVVASTPPAPASLQDALLKGKPSLNARLRYETVDQEGFTDADALTFRVRAGYTTGTYAGFQAMVEGEANVPLVTDYYDGTGTNASRYATVADPEIYELNQAWLSYTHEKTKATLGRQRINLDNARFVGDVAWRQNQQTFDAAVLQDKSFDKLTLTYAYLSKVNRVFDDRAAQYDWNSDSHIANASYAGLPFGTLTGYAYLLDFPETEDLAKAHSSQTYGASFAGSPKITDDISALYRIEYATQRDYASSALNYQSDYYLGELGAKFLKNYTLSLGYEVLGSDDGRAGSGFKTPLSTLHAHNGWADKFLATPDGGLEDTYLKATAALPANLAFTGLYHWFESDETGVAFGTELDLQLTYTFNKQFSATAKAALYTGDSAAPTAALRADTDKYWLQIDYAY
ncbi:MAG: alginate export family protein [Opitutaceae bacterium]|jgi:hypothetical protein|nr:alginate export family protein [Opitutaceae bacterium]